MRESVDPYVSKAVITAFRKRWAEIRRRKRPGGVDRLRLFFEAAYSRDQAKLAYSFYGYDHVEAMCALPDEQIVRNLLAVCRYLEALPKRQCAAIAKGLFEYEYILFDSDPDVFRQCERKPLKQINLEVDNPTIWEVESYPARVSYDDWYERVGGFYDDYLGVLMKATGERFSIRERKMLTESVIDNIKGEWAGPCRIKVTPAAKKNQMVISIHLIRKTYHEQKKRADGKTIRCLPV